MNESAMLGDEPPDLLYHYTSNAGLLGIVETASVWASSIRYLNDESEYEVGLHPVRKWIAIAQDRPENDLPTRLHLSQLAAAAERAAEQNVFVASFSEEGDLLSQWRAYCPAGSGVSIGVPGPLLRKMAKAHGFELSPVIYDPYEQVRVISSECEEFLIRLARNPTHVDEICAEFSVATALLAACMKDDAFAEEREWRAVGRERFLRTPLRFRESRSMIVPFHDLSIATDQFLRIEQVILAPTPHKELAKQSIELLLGRRPCSAKVRNSIIPFRSW